MSTPTALREFAPEVALVLGSGLGAGADALAEEGSLAFAEVPEMPAALVAGHAGRFRWGRLGGRRVVVQQGRVHLYEGHPSREVTAGIRFMAACGVREVALTNAAGIINEAFAPGDWMLLSDHLNLTGTSPLIGRPAFVDMGEIYTPRLRTQWCEIAAEQKVALHEGIYAGVLGPQYETPAEIRMLRTLGADAVGMSTVHEAIEARALGLEVVGLSCLTNYASGMRARKLRHEDVLRASESGAAVLISLLSAAFSSTAPK